MARNRYYSGPISDHFDGDRFFNLGSEAADKSLLDILRWRWTSAPTRWPAKVAIKQVVPDRRVDDARITIVGHASVLIQVHGLNIVTDPHWSERASPVSFVGPKRVSPPAISFDDLPRIDAVLLSHNHYDHLDMATLRRLVARDHPRIITPLGNDTIVKAAIPDANIVAGDWWHRDRLSGDVEVTLVPAQHWSARQVADRRMALWCGFVIQAGSHLIYFAGDTAYGDGRIFRAIRQTLGCPDVALLPIGAYAPRWFMEPVHADPDEAANILLDLEAAFAIGLHWGVFPLSDEGRDDPRVALAEALAKRMLPAERFVAAQAGYVWRPQTVTAQRICDVEAVPI